MSNLKNKYNPNSTGLNNGNIFGLPFSVSESKIVLIPVPWDVTTSYHSGASMGPDAILKASPQLDLYDEELGNIWECGIAIEKVNDKWAKRNKIIRKIAEEYISSLENSQKNISTEKKTDIINLVDLASEELNSWLKHKTANYLKGGKFVGIIGGEHSAPLGFLETLSEKYTDFGILQIDAHCDLRKSYQNLKYSHASIMYNALKMKSISKLVQVGIRDFCEEEKELIKSNDKRIKIFTDRSIKEQIFGGKTWKNISSNIIKSLPENVYISFDIDGLNAIYCQSTGTPVPGGLEIEEVFYLIKMIVKSGRKIIGFDLCEVAPDKSGWAGNVGARIIYRLCGWMMQKFTIIN